MKAEDAKKLKCSAVDGKCGRPASITMRFETTDGPEYMCFCRGHLWLATKALSAMHKEWDVPDLPGGTDGEN